MAKDEKKAKRKPKPPARGRKMPAGNIGPVARYTPPASLPDILFVIIDDLVAADLTASRAPVWTAFVAQARNFTNCYTMPVCSQSRACIQYGRYGRHIGEGFTEEFGLAGPEPAANELTVWQAIRKAGYVPELVGKWHGGRNPSNLSQLFLGAPQARGYEHWTAGVPQNIGNLGGGTYTSWFRVDDLLTSNSSTYATGAQIAQAAARWSTMQRPKLLHVCLSAPHAPFHNPPSGYLEGYVADADANPNRVTYQEMIRSADYALGRLLSMPGVRDALVVVCSDNGTPDGAARQSAPVQDPNRMKGECYDLGTRVPLAIRGPASLVTPGTDARLVHLVDVPGTLLRVAGLVIPSGWDSRDILASTSANVRVGALLEAEDIDNDLEQGAVGYGSGIVSAGYKLIRHTTEAAGDITQDELYNLATDPGETTPLSLAGNAAIVAQLRAIIDAP